jgi:hypothetical protein
MSSIITTIQPPPFVERFQYKECKQINDPVTRKRVYATPDGEKLPSVTTILSATKDMTALNEWKKRVGEEKAQQIVTEASGVGTAMHANLERFLCGMERQPGNNPVHVQANKMADVIIENGLSKMSEVWAMEQSLQLMAYILAHNEVYGTDIRKGVIFMCSRDFQYQQFTLEPKDFNKYQDLWLSKVEEYYTKGMQGYKQLLS